MEVQGKCTAIQHQCCAAHLLCDLSVFVESAGEVAGTAGNAMSGCWPWENRVVETTSVCHPHRGFPANARIGAGSRLPDLLHQATVPGLLTSCCDFPLQDLPETVLKKRQAPHSAQKSSRQLAPCPHPYCAVYVACLHLSPHPPSPTLQIPLLAQQASPNRFSLLHLLFAFPLCTSSLSQPPTPPPADIFPSHHWHSSCGRWTLLAQLGSSCFPPLPKTWGGRQRGPLPPANHPLSTQSRARKTGQKGRASGHLLHQPAPYDMMSIDWFS